MVGNDFFLLKLIKNSSYWVSTNAILFFIYYTQLAFDVGKGSEEKINKIRKKLSIGETNAKAPGKF